MRPHSLIYFSGPTPCPHCPGGGGWSCLRCPGYCPSISPSMCPSADPLLSTLPLVSICVLLSSRHCSACFVNVHVLSSETPHHINTLIIPLLCWGTERLRVTWPGMEPNTIFLMLGRFSSLVHPLPPLPGVVSFSVHSWEPLYWFPPPVIAVTECLSFCLQYFIETLLSVTNLLLVVSGGHVFLCSIWTLCHFLLAAFSGCLLPSR